MTTDEIQYLLKKLRRKDRHGYPHCGACEEAADAIEALQADAVRLDYIASNARCDPKMDGNHVWWPTSFNHRLIGPTLREAIDAAMALDKPR